MFFLLKCALHFIFLNFLVHTCAQDILSALLGGVQNGMNLVNNNLDVGKRDFFDYRPPANRDVGFLRSNEVSQSNQNQNESEEPNISNSKQRHRGYTNSNSEEYDGENTSDIGNNKRFPVNNQMIYNKQQNNIKRPFRQPALSNGNIKSKPIIRDLALRNNQKPLPLVKERLESISITPNKDSFNPGNVTMTINNGSSTTSIPCEFLVNSTVTDNIPNLSAQKNPLNTGCVAVTEKTIEKDTNKNVLKPLTKTIEKDTNKNVLKPLTKTIEKDTNKNVLKPLTKRKFFFQAKPVMPLSEEVSILETIYYIDLD